MTIAPADLLAMVRGTWVEPKKKDEKTPASGNNSLSSFYLPWLEALPGQWRFH